MQDILTVTLNAAVDLATSVDHVVPGPKLRCGPAQVDPGGGGVNVARGIVQLGGTARALVAVGGATGAMLVRLIEAEGVCTIPVEVTGETRRNLAVTDAQSGAQYRFSLCSDTLTAQDEAALLAAVAEQTMPGGFVVLSGGLAPGMSLGFHARAKAAVAARTRKIILDTCEPALSYDLRHQDSPFHVLRLDQAESAQAAGFEVVTIGDSIRFATMMRDRGIAEIVIAGRGAEGSVMVTPEGQWFCHAPKVPVCSKIGAGDAFVGALTLALAQGRAPAEALQHGVAAASATVETPGTVLGSAERVRDLLPRCRVEAL